MSRGGSRPPSRRRSGRYHGATAHAWPVIAISLTSLQPRTGRNRTGKARAQPRPTPQPRGRPAAGRGGGATAPQPGRGPTSTRRTGTRDERAGARPQDQHTRGKPRGERKGEGEHLASTKLRGPGGPYPAEGGRQPGEAMGTPPGVRCPYPAGPTAREAIQALPRKSTHLCNPFEYRVRRTGAPGGTHTADQDARKREVVSAGVLEPWRLRPGPGGTRVQTPRGGLGPGGVRVLT